MKTSNNINIGDKVQIVNVAVHHFGDRISLNSTPQTRTVLIEEGAPFQILLDGFNIIGETVLFMSRDGAEFTIPKNQIRDILSINFPMEARVEHGEISRKHFKYRQPRHVRPVTRIPWL